MTLAVENIPLTIRLDRDLRDARAHLAALEAQRGDVALDVVDGAPDAAAKLEIWRQEITAAREVVADLAAALTAASRRLEQQQRAAVAKVRQSQISSIRQRLGAQAKSIARLAAALENANASWFEIVKQASEIRATCDASGISLPLEYASGNAARLRIWAKIEIWRTNRTARDSSGLFPSGLLEPVEGQLLAAGLAVEGFRDLSSGNPAHAKPLVSRLDEERAALIAYISGAPLPHSLVDPDENLFVGVAPEPPVTVTGPVPISEFRYAPDFPSIVAGDGTPAVAEVKPIVPLDVEMAGDALDQALLRQFEEAAAKGAAERTSEQQGQPR